MAATYETSLTPVLESWDGTTGETVNVVFNAGSGANRVLLVCVDVTNTNQVITGVTYNGVAMTSLGTAVQYASTTRKIQLWALANPASGSNTIAITMGTGDANAGGYVMAEIVNSADIAGTPWDGYASNTGSGSTANLQSTLTIASATGDRVVVFYASTNGDSNITATPTAYTERQEANDGLGYTVEHGDGDGAASVNTIATWNNGAFTVNWGAVGINVNAEGGAVGVNVKNPVALQRPFNMQKGRR